MRCPNCNKEVIMQPSFTIEGDSKLICPSCGVSFQHVKIVEDSTDWQSFRKEAAMRAMQAFISKPYVSHENGIKVIREIYYKDAAKYAILAADALIAELKKG